MRLKPILLILLLMLSGFISFAHTGGKYTKENPDMIGFVMEAETGKPLKDVSVTAYNSSRKEKSATSASNGSFALTDLKAGVYKFIFEKDGFEKITREKVVVRSNEGNQINIQMSRESDTFDMVPSPFRFSSK